MSTSYLYHSEQKLQSLEEESTTSSLYGSANDSLGRYWWAEEIEMFWEQKERMQRMDDLGVELSGTLVEFVFLLHDNGDDKLLNMFQGFVYDSWSSPSNEDRLVARKAMSLIYLATGFLEELNKKQNKTGKDEEDSKRLTLKNCELFDELLDDIGRQFLAIEEIMVLLQKSMRANDECYLEPLDLCIEIGKENLEELKDKIEKLKKESHFFCVFISEMDEFWNGDFELEINRLWNTSWDLEDEFICENSARFNATSDDPSSCSSSEIQ